MWTWLACTGEASFEDSGKVGDSEPVESPPTHTGLDSDSGTDPHSDPTTEPTPYDIVVSENAAVSAILEVDWSLPEAADATWIEFSFEDDEWHTSPEAEGSAGAHHEVVLGAPTDTDVSIRVAWRRDGAEARSEVVTGRTGALPDALPAVEIRSWEEALAAGERWLLGSVDEPPGRYDGPVWSFILDRKGRYVWWHETQDDKLSLYVQPSQDGRHVLIDENAFYIWDDTPPGVTRVTLDHREEQFTEIPDFGFAIDEGPDGVLYYEGEDGPDTALKLRRPDGSEELIWNATDWARRNGYPSDSWNTMPNTIVWDADHQSVFWSMFEQSTVVEIDVESGEELRQFGQLGGMDFDPVEAEIDYQHYVNRTPEGTILASTHAAGHEQLAREYRVEGDSLVEVWHFGESVDWYAEYAGEAWRHTNGNTLIGYGTDGAILEVTPEGEVAWEVVFADSPLVGHCNLVDDLYALNAGVE